MKSPITRAFLLIVNCLIFITSIKCQDKDNIKFYEIIKDDSVVMFFNHAYIFTDKKCAQYKRYTRIDALGNFSNSFIDSSATGFVAGTGFYKDGLKEGYFENFHTNGTIKAKGKFKNNKPSGYWHYFYENGKPEKTVLFNLADTLLLEFYDADGTATVKDGNGNFNGWAGSAIDKFLTTFLFASGQIVNGKPHGIWNFKLAGTNYCKENYDKGVFISGTFPKPLMGESKIYKDYSYANIIYQPFYVYKLEEFITSKCYETTSGKDKQLKKSPLKYNLDNFRSFVSDVVGTIINDDIRNGNFKDYLTGENFLKIQFKINEKGVPADFKKITSWGDQYYNALTSALSMHVKLPYTGDIMFLSVTVIKSESNNINYRFFFSAE